MIQHAQQGLLGNFIGQGIELRIARGKPLGKRVGERAADDGPQILQGAFPVGAPAEERARIQSWLLRSGCRASLLRAWLPRSLSVLGEAYPGRRGGGKSICRRPGLVVWALKLADNHPIPAYGRLIRRTVAPNRRWFP